MYLLKKKHKRLSSRHYADLYLCPCGNIFSRRTRDKVKCLSCKGKYKKDVIFCYVKLYNEYKRSASRRSLSFSVDFFSFILFITDKCFYCDSDKMNTLTTPYRTLKYNGIDRVDNNMGYEMTNCVTCCKICNFAKRDMSKTEFISWAKTITNKDEQRC